MGSFATYKKNKTDVTSLTKKVEELAEGNKKSYKDDRFWRPTVDKAGNGSARIRFLPACDGEDLPWIQYHEHNFDIDGSYFIELCPTTLGRECPVCKSNTQYWKTEIESNQTIARNRKRKLVYVANILILKDKEASENEGKVFLFQFGQKIFEKIKLMLKPKDESDEAVNVFDFWEGADFGLEIKQLAGYRNYDDSAFKGPTPLFKGDDQKLEAIYTILYKLQPFVAETKFKSYEDLDKKFQDTVSGKKVNVQKKAEELFGTEPAAEAPAEKKTRKPKADKTPEDTAPWEDAVTKPSAKKTRAAAAPVDPISEEDVQTESDDALNYYEEMAAKD